MYAAQSRLQLNVWRVGDEASRADILAGCRTRKDPMRPLITVGTYREDSAGGKELLVDFNASSVHVGWHYHWSVKSYLGLCASW